MSLGTRIRRLGAFLWVLALLVAPGIAYLAGQRQSLFVESRPPTPRPALTLASLGDASTFGTLDAYLRDRIPWRDDAQQLRGHIEYDGFRYSSSPDVIIGRGDRLYYAIEDRVCGDGRPLVDPVLAIRYLVSAARRSGRHAVFIPSASKTYIERDRLGFEPSAQLRCAFGFEDDLLRRLSGNLDVPPINNRFQALHARGVEPFRARDTHWGPIGLEIFVRAVLDGLQPGLANRVGLHISNRTRVGEAGLARFLRFPETPRERDLDAERRGPDASDQLIVGDSQLETAFLNARAVGRPPLIDVVLPNVQFCRWPDIVSGKCDVRLRKTRAAAFELVMRNADMIDRGCARALSVWLADVRGRAARIMPDGAGAARSAVVGQTPLLTRVVDAAERTDRDRVIVIPISGGPKGQIVSAAPTTRADGRYEPCGAFEADAAGGTVFLPVGRGRALADAPIQFAAPPGTVIGRPRVIDLPDLQR